MYLPTNTILVHLPVGSFLSIEHLIGMVDVVLEPFRDLPLSIFRFWRRHRDVATRQHLPNVLEDGLAPPLELLVLRRRETADEWACDDY